MSFLANFNNKVCKCMAALALLDECRSDTTSVVPERLWSVGDVVRKLRERRGWTQAALAAEAELNRTSIIGLEAEPEKSDQRTIMRAAKALEIPLADLYAYADAVTLNAEQRELLNLFDAIEAQSERETLLHLARNAVRAQEAKRQHSEQQPGSPADQRATGTEGSSRSRKE